mmetsp:Transcript_22660/g.57748  ORF Transcript_22660/g.57748 Transcript_22660/m.57748 type:complete len:101 (-) Transcript_22660:675-977(-)
MAKNQPVYFEVYRYTSLGYTLQDTLGDLIEQGEITQDKSTEIMKAFDKAMNEGLASMDLPPVKMKVCLPACIYTTPTPHPTGSLTILFNRLPAYICDCTL